MVAVLALAAVVSVIGWRWHVVTAHYERTIRYESSAVTTKRGDR